jgi:hypothetical protein
MNETSWGMLFNESSIYRHFNKTQSLPGCPDWLTPNQINTWQEHGLVIWNNIDKKIVVLNGGKSLALLQQLESNDNWKIEGVSVTELVYQFEFQIPSRGRRKKGEPEPKTEATKSEYVNIEILHLPPEAGSEIIDLLNMNKNIISNMAKQEKERFDEAMKQFFEWMLESSRKEETSNFNFSARTFQWIPKGKFRWVCEHQTTDGHVCLNESKLFWCACVNKKGHFEKSEYSEKFLGAIEWAETEMANLANQPEVPDSHPQIRTEEQRNDELVMLRKKLKGGPYWIDPLSTEPNQISYKILIQIDTKPTKFETIETRCGDVLHVNERFPSSSNLAKIANLDLDQFNFLQPAGENTDWHLVTSLTTFYQETSAAEQAQKVWNQSSIVQQYKNGIIRRARYGYQEVETGFEIYLGACEDPMHPWWKPETREEHMEQLALRESISFSLDPSDFRDFLGVSIQTITDEQIFRIMHSTRARSKYMTKEIKLESKIWLAQHDLAQS